MHPEQKQFVERVRALFPTKFIGGNVLDVGSMDINGNNRQFFYQPERYVGVDIAVGSNVDMVIPSGEPFPDYFEEFFDAVISTECMEHNKNYIMTINEMWRSLKPGGLMVMTMASHKRPEHGTTKSDPAASPFTKDYYMNIYLSDMTNIMVWEKAFFPFCFEYSGAYDLYFYGIKTF